MGGALPLEAQLDALCAPQLRQLCCALSRASDHHHNLLALVQLFLDVSPRSRWVLPHLRLPAL